MEQRFESVPKCVNLPSLQFLFRKHAFFVSTIIDYQQAGTCLILPFRTVGSRTACIEPFTVDSDTQCTAGSNALTAAVSPAPTSYVIAFNHAAKALSFKVAVDNDWPKARQGRL